MDDGDSYCVISFSYSTEAGSNNLQMSDIEVSKVRGAGGGGGGRGLFSLKL